MSHITFSKYDSIIVHKAYYLFTCTCVQWCSRKYLGTGAVQNISMVLFLEREH